MQQLSVDVGLEDLLTEVSTLPSEWAFVACGGNKAPIGDNWQRIPLRSDDFHAAVKNGKFEKLSIQPKTGTRQAFKPPADWCKSIGVLCGEPSGGLLFFDHDGASCDQWIEEQTGQTIKEALPASAVVTSGRKGRYQIIYRVPAEYWDAIATTKKKTGMVGDDGKPEQVEFRWTGTQSIVLGMHPQTGKYRWIYHPSDKPIVEAPLWMIEVMLKEHETKVRPVVTPITGDGIVDLIQCCAPKTREALLGRFDKGRNDAGIAIANDLLGTAHHLENIGQPFFGNPESIFFDWCSSVGLDTDTPKGQPEALWRSANRRDKTPSLTSEMIDGCIRKQLREQKQTQPQSVSENSNGHKLSVDSISVDQSEQAQIEKMKSDLRIYEAERDPFRRVLLENELSKNHKIAGRKLENLIDALNPTPLSDFQFMDELCSEVYAQIETRAASSTIPGYKTGFYDLDAMAQGFQGGDLIILAARPSMGKTGLACNIARNLCEINNVPVVFFSLEMSKHQLHYRLLSAESEISAQRLKSGRVAEKEWTGIAKAIGSLSGLPIAIDDTSDITVSKIKTKINSLMEVDCVKDRGSIGAIFIDYLQLMNSDRDGENRTLELAKITRQLKGLARQLNVPIIALSQLSRSVEQRTDKRPMMSDLRDSGGIEQDADLILMLYREEYYKPETDRKGVAELIVSKNRNGPVGTVNLLFQPDFVKFKNYRTY